MTEFANVPLREIIASLTNPRTTFNPVKLAELAEGIKAMGVHTPVLLRPLPGHRVTDTDRFVQYELVAGERRLRASEIAKVPTIPAMIRPLTDDEALLIQLVENIEREDLTELEEAEGFAKLMEHSGMTADAVGEKISKSRAYVYGSLKLLDLSQECKQALRDGKIKASHALLIARIPDAKLQTKALAEATRPITATGDQFISVRAFQSWLQANVMLRLDAATFAITDTRLVKDVGSCKDCPKRTGANPDLFQEVNSADLCTDPACYHAKSDAHRTAMITKAESRGLRLVEGKEAKEICKPNSSKLDGYLPLSQLRQDAIHMIPEGSNKVPTLRDLLGKDAPDPVLIEHPVTKELIEAVPTAETEALLITRGLIKASQEQTNLEEQTAREIETLKRQLDTRVERQSVEAIFQAVVTGVRAMPDARVVKLLDGEVLRAWLLAMLGEEIDEDDMALMLGYTFEEGLDEIDALSMHIRASNTPTLLRALVIYMAMRDRIYFGAPEHARHINPILTGLCPPLQISTEDITAQVKKTVKAETAQQIKALQATLRAHTAKSVNTQSETPSKGEGGEQHPKAKTAKPTAARSKTKISAAEATSGIAAAMQGIEDQATTASPDDSSAPEAPLRPCVAWPFPGQSDFEVGQQARVTTDDAKLGLVARKWAGKTGTITRREDGGGYWDVTFKGRGGGVAMFAEDQLEAVAA